MMLCRNLDQVDNHSRDKSLIFHSLESDQPRQSVRVIKPPRTTKLTIRFRSNTAVEKFIMQ